MTQFDPVLMDDIRQALSLDDPRATEHVWYAIQAIEAAGTQVLVKNVQAALQLNSVDLTMQMLQEKYKK